MNTTKQDESSLEELWTVTLSDALTIKDLIDCVGGDIVLQRLKDEAKDVILQALIDGEIGGLEWIIDK